MAYIPQQIPEKEQNQFGLKTDTTPNPIPPQTGGSAGTASQGPGGAPGQATSTQFGSNASKLSDYLKANEPQVNEFGQKVAQNLTNDYNSTLSAVDTGFQDFGQQVNQGYTAPNQDIVNQAVQNPTEFVNNPENVSQFQSLYNDEYKGPQNVESWQPYSDINSKVNQSVQNAGLTKDFSGLGSYLNNFMGTGQNTKGMQTLDTALLQRSPTARTAIETAAQPFQGLSDYLTGKVKSGNENVASAKDTANQTKQNAQNQFIGQGGVIPTLQNDISNRLTQTRGQQSNAVDQAIINYQNGEATPQDLQLLGFNPDDLGDKALSNQWQVGKALNTDYGVPTDWSSFFTKQSPDVIYGSPGSVATPEEIAKSQALSQLTGNDLSSWLGSTSPAGSMVNTDKAGLGELGMNLSQRDTDAILPLGSIIAGVSDWNGGPAPSMGDLVQMVQRTGRTPDQIYNAVASSSASTPAILNALKRMGWGPSSEGTGGVGVGTGGGYVHASNTPGVF